MKKLVASLAITGLVAALTAPAVGSGKTVTVSDYKFRAKTVHISHGTTVTWKWAAGSDKHNVTFHGFHSKTQAKGSYKHTFNKPGTYKYHCTIHGQAFGMHGSRCRTSPWRRSPRMLSMPARCIHPAEPVYHVQPPRPTWRGFA